MLLKLISAIFLIAALFVSGCGDNYRPAETIPFVLGDQALASELLAEMEARGVWYEQIDDTRFLIANPPPDWLVSMANERIRERLPAERSRSFPAAIHARLVPEMRRQGLDFELVSFGGEEWVICSTPGCEEIEGLAREIIAQMRAESE